MKIERYDVVAVDHKTHQVSIIAQSKNEQNAEAIICMSIARRGLDTQFFTPAPAGRYKEGDVFKRETFGH